MDDSAPRLKLRLKLLGEGLARAQEALFRADSEISSLLGTGFPIEQMDLEFQAELRARIGLEALCREIERLKARGSPAPARPEGARIIA